MKLVVFILLLLSQECLAQNPFSPFSYTKPKGKVDSVLIYHHPDEGVENYLYVYNRQGRLIAFNLYRHWVIPDFHTTLRDTIKITYSYDKAGKLVCHGPGNTLCQYISTKSGYSIRTNSYDSTKVFEMRFNKSGQMTQSGVYERDNLVNFESGSCEYQYDNSGRLISQIRHYNKLLPPEVVTYKYKDNDDEIAVSSTSRGYSRKTNYTYSNFDKMLNWTQRAADFVNGFEEDDSIHHMDTVRRRITYHK